MRPITFLSILGFSLALAGCEQKPKEEETKIATAPEKATQDKDDVVEELRSYANRKRQQYGKRRKRY